MSQVQKSRKNSRISIKRRESLIKLVLSEGNTIRYAAHKLSIKPSTAQQIMKKYKETGKVFYKIMNKSKTASNSTNSSESEHLSSRFEVENMQRPIEHPQAVDVAEQMRLLNENFLMQQTYLQWMNLQFQMMGYYPVIYQ